MTDKVSGRKSYSMDLRGHTFYFGRALPRFLPAAVQLTSPWMLGIQVRRRRGRPDALRRDSLVELRAVRLLPGRLHAALEQHPLGLLGAHLLFGLGREHLLRVLVPGEWREFG